METPHTDQIRDRVVGLLQEQGATYEEVGSGMGVSKQAAHNFIKGGRIEYENGKRLETWLDEKGR